MLPKIPWTNVHRTFPYPAEPWVLYQEWHDVIFLHYKMEKELIEPIIPPELKIDLFEGFAWISIVVFTVRNFRPRLLPTVPPFSNFYEINLRTYVTKDGVPGIYFFSLEASNKITVLAARLSTGLPYVKSNIWREDKVINSHSPSNGFKLHIDYILHGKEHKERTAKDAWLTDRYRLYVKTSGKISKIDVHHHPWEIQPVTLRDLSTNYKIGKYYLCKHVPKLVHYSPGVRVATWIKKFDLHGQIS